MLPSASKAAILVSLDNKEYSSRCDFSAARLFGRRRSSGPGGRGRARLFRSGGFDRRRRRRGRLGGGRRSCARRGLLMRMWTGGALGTLQPLVNNLARDRFVDGALAVPDPALRDPGLAL